MFTSIWLVLDLGVMQTPREVLLGLVILCRQVGPDPASAPGCPLGKESKGTATVTAWLYALLERTGIHNEQGPFLGLQQSHW